MGESLTEVRNQSLELGFNWQRDWPLNGRRGPTDPHGSYGIDYFGRRGVDADERVESLAGEPLEGGSFTSARTLDGASEDEAAAYGTVRWSWGPATFQAGGRLTWQHQTNEGAPSREDTAGTAFLGLVRSLANGFELTANLGTGSRFPNLSERFFTGTTGRGQVIGNPDLDAESSRNLDLGLRWFGDQAFWNVQFFDLRIDAYIERIDMADGTRTFVNLTSGTIRGLEVEGSY